MAIFSAPVTDDFNRPDAPNLGANWGVYSIVTAQETFPTLASFQANGRSLGESPAYGACWLPATFTNAELYMTLTSFPTGSFTYGSSFMLYTRVQGQGTAFARSVGILIEIPFSFSNQGIPYIAEFSGHQVVRTLAGPGSQFPVERPSKIGMRIYERPSTVSFPGTVIEFWTFQPIADGAWVKKLSAFDPSTNRITAAGPAGMSGWPAQTFSSVLWDDFSVATLVAPPASGINTDDYPNYAGAFPDEPYLAQMGKDTFLPGADSWNVISDRPYLARRGPLHPTWEAATPKVGLGATRGGVEIFTRYGE